MERRAAGIPGGGVFFVQAVDGAGNVAATANKGQNYELVGDAPLAVAVVTGDQQDDGWYVGPATIELQGSAVENPDNAYEVVINGGDPAVYGGPFELTTEGENIVEITGVGAPPIRLVVPVDLTAPSVELVTPIARLAPENPDAPADVLSVPILTRSVDLLQGCEISIPLRTASAK